MVDGLRDPLSIDLHAGVGRFMHSVYAWMAAGVAVSAVTAAYLGLGAGALAGPGLLVWPALAIAVLAVGVRLPRLPPALARVAFLSFSVLLGAALAWLGTAARVVPAQVATAAVLAAGVFAAASLLGYYTRRDLAAWGGTLAALLIGALVAMFIDLVAFQLHAPLGLGEGGLHLVLQGLLWAVFAGFVAHDSQRVKQMYRAHGSRENLAVVGALKLYLDYVNLVLATLQVTAAG